MSRILLSASLIVVVEHDWRRAHGRLCYVTVAAWIRRFRNDIIPNAGSLSRVLYAAGLPGHSHPPACRSVVQLDSLQPFSFFALAVSMEIEGVCIVRFIRALGAVAI